MTQSKDPYRRYIPAESITFRKTNESFGGLSNMASGFVLWVNGTRILTSEALYQACRFPHLPEVQRSIIMQGSPMTAKMKSKPFRDQSRTDWDQVRVKIMRWCLRVKLAQNWASFSELLLRTGDKPIVEDSRKDRFWGAVMNDKGVLEGRNALGRLLMELREELKGANREVLRMVQPIDIPDFLLYGQPIGLVEAKTMKPDESAEGRRLQPLGTIWSDEPVKTYAPPAAKADLFSEPKQLMEVHEPKPNEPLKPYPAYKPAAVPWIRQVPKHWEVLPNRALFTEVKEAGRPEDEMLSVTIGRGVLKQAEHLSTTTKKDSSRKDKSTYKRVAEGDIVYNKMRAWQGAFGMSRFRGIVSPAYVVQRPTEKANSAYYHYLFRTPLFAKEAERNSYGLASDIWNLRPEHFKTILNVCPPLEEQHLIVRYLRALDAKVKRYIRTKRKLIAALQEQKQAIIQRAVTRGLDPERSPGAPSGVKLKPSGVAWLGEVPEHWEVRSNRSMLRIRKVQVGERSKDYVLLSLTLRGVIARDMENPEGKFPAEFNTYQEVRPGDLVFCLFDVDETPRTVGLSQLHGMITGAYTVFECIDPMIAKFLYYFYLAVDHQKSLKPFYTGLRKVVQKSTFLGIKVAIPSRNEIAPIIEYLEQEVGAVDAGIARVEQEIKLMNEYHTRLIADVVTGAVDVREAARKLPEEDQMIGRSEDQMMEEEPLSMAAEDAVGYGEEPEL